MTPELSNEKTPQTAPSSHTSDVAYDAIKAKQKVAWGSGNYAAVGVTLQIVGEQLAESMDLIPSVKVLDVAAGNGNATLAFARRGHQVTSTDYVDDLLSNGRERATAEGLEVRFKIADAEALPFGAGSFDAVVSTYGVMFAPNQKQAAQELMRVCRPGGSIGMANWTPDGFIGQLFKTLGQHVAPPPGVKSPALWGDERWLNETFSEAGSVNASRRNFIFRYPSPKHFIDLFRNLYGPVHKAFQALDADGQQALENDLLKLVGHFNTADDGSMRVPAEYLDVIIAKA